MITEVNRGFNPSGTYLGLLSPMVHRFTRGTRILQGRRNANYRWSDKHEIMLFSLDVCRKPVRCEHVYYTL